MERDNSLDARIAAAKAMGLSDRMSEDILIIDGIPEYRPEGSSINRKPAIDPRKVDLLQYDGD